MLLYCTKQCQADKVVNENVNLFQTSEEFVLFNDSLVYKQTKKVKENENFQVESQQESTIKCECFISSFGPIWIDPIDKGGQARLTNYTVHYDAMLQNILCFPHQPFLDILFRIRIVFCLIAEILWSRLTN